MKRLFFLLCGLLFLSLGGITAQSDANSDFFLVNSKKLDPDRYKEIKGSPYWFEEWPSAKLVDLQDKSYENIVINFNGLTKDFEIKRGGDFIVLDEKQYKLLEIEIEGKKVTFLRGIDRRKPDKFMWLVYKNNNFSIVKDFIVNQEERKIEAPGKTILLKKFIPHENYYIARLGELTLFKLDKKNIAREFGQEMLQISKENDWKLDTEEGFVKSLEILETKGK